MTDQTLGWRTNERIARLHDEAERRRLADRVPARPVAGRTRIARYLDSRIGRRPEPVATVRA